MKLESFLLHKGYFVTGTDTGAGKTVFTAALIRFLIAEGLSTAGLKPVASGFEQLDGHLQNDDVRRITEASNVKLADKRINRYGFKAAIAPHIAATAEGVTLDPAAIANDVRHAQANAERVVVEGVGGWLVPLGDELSIASLAMQLKLPVILVVGMRLGCLNHALLTAQAIQQSGLPFLGWVSNQVDPDFSHLEQNIASLDARMPVKRIFDLPYCQQTDKCEINPI